MRVSEIHVKRIRVNQGLGVSKIFFFKSEHFSQNFWRNDLVHIFLIQTESTFCLLQTLIFVNVTLKNFGNVVDSYLAESGKSVLKTICTIACFRLCHFVFYLVKF